MTNVATGARITLKNVLYLTDFSQPSEMALPFAVSVAREYEARLYAFHVLIPKAYAYMTPELTVAALNAQEEVARLNMQRVEAQLDGLPHASIIERGTGVWPLLEELIKEYAIDLIVVGTHGRTGPQKLLLGSVAEEVFRRSHVPVLTIGPAEHGGAHKTAKFRRVLFATDFTVESLAGVPYAVSMAQENDGRLILLHVMKEPDTVPNDQATEDATSSVMHQLQEIVPAPAELWCRPEAVVRSGRPAEQILKVARECDADLIVMGIRDARAFIGAATHLERTTAHNVVVRATCPVLTVRS